MRQKSASDQIQGLQLRLQLNRQKLIELAAPVRHRRTIRGALKRDRDELRARLRDALERPPLTHRTRARPELDTRERRVFRAGVGWAKVESRRRRRNKGRKALKRSKTSTTFTTTKPPGSIKPKDWRRRVSEERERIKKS